MFFFFESAPVSASATESAPVLPRAPEFTPESTSAPELSPKNTVLTELFCVWSWRLFSQTQPWRPSQCCLYSDAIMDVVLELVACPDLTMEVALELPASCGGLLLWHGDLCGVPWGPSVPFALLWWLSALLWWTSAPQPWPPALAKWERLRLL